MGVPVTSASDVCVKEMERTNGKAKVLEKVMKYWLRLLVTDETPLLGDALRQQRKEGERTG
jgi:hypothetical protein